MNIFFRQHQEPFKINAAAVILTGYLLLALVFLNLFIPTIRLSTAISNDIAFFSLTLLIPLTQFIASLFLKRSLTKIVGFFYFLIQLSLFLCILFFGVLISGLAEDELLTQINLSDSSIRAYRTNGGATTDFGVMIRQEMKLIPGVLLVKVLHSGYHEYNATIESTMDTSIYITIEKTNDKTPLTKRINIKRLVYF